MGDNVDAGQPEEILGQVVKNASHYTAMRTPGSLQPSHFYPPFSGELVLLTVPDVMNPLDLINSEVMVGGKKECVVVAGGQKYRMATYSADTNNYTLPSLFLPDQDGQLTKVPVDIKASLVVKGEVEEREEDDKNCVDIEALRSTHYKAPKEIRRRDFFSKTRTMEVMMKTEKPAKRKKKNASNLCNSLDDSLQSRGEVQGSGKKKKSKHLPPNSNESKENVLHDEVGYLKRKIKKEIAESGEENLKFTLKGKKKSKDKKV